MVCSETILVLIQNIMGIDKTNNLSCDYLFQQFLLNSIEDILDSNTGFVPAFHNFTGFYHFFILIFLVQVLFPGFHNFDIPSSCLGS